MKRVELEKSVITGLEAVELMEEASLSMIDVAGDRTTLKGAAKEKEIERLEHLHHVLLHALRDNGLERAFEIYKQSTETMLYLADIESKIPSSILNDLRESNDLNYRSSKATLENKQILVNL